MHRVLERSLGTKSKIFTTPSFYYYRIWNLLCNLKVGGCPLSVIEPTLQRLVIINIWPSQCLNHFIICPTNCKITSVAVGAWLVVIRGNPGILQLPFLSGYVDSCSRDKWSVYLLHISSYYTFFASQLNWHGKSVLYHSPTFFLSWWKWTGSNFGTTVSTNQAIDLPPSLVGLWGYNERVYCQLRWH